MLSSRTLASFYFKRLAKVSYFSLKLPFEMTFDWRIAKYTTFLLFWHTIVCISADSNDLHF